MKAAPGAGKKPVTYTTRRTSITKETLEARADEMTCPRCGATSVTGVRFCSKCGESLDTEASRTGAGAGRMDYQVTGRRIVAALMDIALFTVLFLVMAAAMGDFGTTDDNGFAVSLTGGPALIFFLLVFGYYIVLEGLLAATVGKMIMGLTVKKLTGEAYGWGPVLLRNILRIVDALPLLYLVGFVCVAVTGKNQRLGDLAAGTTVVRVP